MTATRASSPRRASKYDRLTAYLQALPAAQETVTLTFGEIEALLARRLPYEARTATFWGETSRRAAAWRGAGFTARLVREPWSVEFRRGKERAMRARIDGRRKYGPLQRYLAALPAGQTTVVLTFPEIEALIGAALPSTAGTHVFWASRNWDRQRAVAFTARLFHAERQVVFVRRQP